MKHLIQTTALLTLATAGTGTARAETAINFFGDVAYSIGKHEEITNSFQAATLDIFAMQREGKFGFMGEIVGSAFGSNTFEIDIDRLEASYQPRPWLRFRAGRLRTAWGYYGDAYQNGKFFMVPVVWPDVYESFDEEGILPSHSVGLHGDAAYSLGESAGKITIDAEILNGRGRTFEEIAAFEDANNGKAVNVRLRYVGSGKLDGLIVGGNLYIDQIPGDEDTGVPEMDELIVGGHVAYFGHNIHAVGELTWFRHSDDAAGMVHRTVTGFVEAGYTIDEEWTPYARYEHTVFADTGDMFFAPLTEDTFIKGRISTGVKYAASSSVAFKLQGSLQKDDDDIDKIAIIQAAFAF